MEERSTFIRKLPIPMEIKVGDQVLYGKYSGTEVTVDGNKYLIVRQSDILAVL